MSNTITPQEKFTFVYSKAVEIFNACGKDIPLFNSDLGLAVQVLSGIIDEQHSYPEMNYTNGNGLSEQELKEENEETAYNFFEALNELESKIGEDDFYFEYDGFEYRIISDISLWDTYRDTIQEITEDCWDLKLDNLPSFLAFEIDWEQTANNCLVDGYAHTFSSYDGETHIEVAEYNVFRHN